MPLTVLVVDDSRDFRYVLAELLRRDGHVVLEASNGTEALQLLKMGAMPSIVLLDLHMPVMDGWMLRAEMLNDDALSLIPTIVLTGHPERIGDSEGLRAAAYVNKTQGIAAVRRAIQQVCDPSSRSMNPSLRGPVDPTAIADSQVAAGLPDDAEH